MCGICGIIDRKANPVTEARLQKMLDAMKRRGPDDEGTFVHGNTGLGFVRLSILDLSPAGHQPMVSKDGRYVIVFNGEVYNYIELREELTELGHTFETRTDTEVLLAAYRQWGAECLNRFNGMWAFVIYDKEENHIFAARDRFGVKPFYYSMDEKEFIFASEIPPILQVWGKQAKPEEQAIFDYLVFNRTDQTDSTFFESIKKLQHGHCLTIKNNELKIWKWYDLRSNLKAPFQTPAEYREAFSSAVGLRLRSDVPVGVCLSGGIDSSSIVGTLLVDHNKKDLNTFSAVYGKGNKGDESHFIDEFKPVLNHMYYTYPDAATLKNDLQDYVKAQGEPLPSTGPYAQFKVMEIAKGRVVVTLDGQGADEQLAGYHYFFGFFFKDLLSKGKILTLTDEIIQYLRKHHSVYGLKTFAYFLLPKSMRTKLRVNEKGYLYPEFIQKYKSGNTIAGNLYGSDNLHEALIDHFEYKLEHLLKWEDRNSMWFSIESRVPFLDYRLVERTLSLPSTSVIRKGMTKYYLREAMKSVIPEKIRLRRDKIGFMTPEDEWFRTPEWQQIVKDLLSSKSFRERNIINHEKALEQYKKHLSREINISKEIWKWVNLELWFRTYID
jgi:asparagine synthase (glutamine-hydrolysing)